MSDDQQPSPLDRRRFLTVLGVSAGGGALALSAAARRTGCRSWCPIWCSRRTRSPASPPGTRAPARSAASGCGVHVRTREGRAVKLEGNPDHPINRGKLCSRGQASLQGLYNPGRIRAPMLRGANGSFTEITWDDAIARLAAKLTEAGGRIAVISGAGRGTFSDLLAEWTAALGGRLVRHETFDHEPMRAANRQVFGLDQMPALRLRPGEVHRLLRRRLPGHWGSMVENQLGFARSHGFGEGDVAKLVYAAPRAGPDGTQRGRVAADHAGLGDVTRAGDGLRARAASGATPGLASALSSVHSRRGRAKETGLPAETDRRGWRASSRRPARVSPWPGASAAQHRGEHRAVRRGQRAQLRGGQHRADGALRRRSRPWPTATPSWPTLSQAMDGGEVAVLLVHDANPVYTAAQGHEVRRGDSPRCRFKVSTSSTSTRPPPRLRPAAAAASRARALGRRPRPGRRLRADAAGDGAGVQHPAARRDPPAGEQEGLRLAGQVHCRHAGTSSSRPGGRTLAPERARPTRPGSGTARCSTAACIGSRRRRRRSPSCSRAAKLGYSRPDVRRGWRASPS